jgi:hypothetical protein
MRREMFFAWCLLVGLCLLPILITQPVDENKLVTLAGNTRPEAKAKTIAGRWPTAWRWSICCSS